MAAYHWFRLLVILLACSFLISSNAIPMSSLSNLQKGSDEFIMASKGMNQNQKTSEEMMQVDHIIEGRMDIEKNDYGPPSSNPIHTRPPRT